jgi:flagellar biosynthesis/type III secretory pathway protein FliH
VVPPALSEGPFREALEVTRMATFTPEEWELNERAKMAEQDARGALAVAHQEGVEEGHRAGLAEGRKSGLVEGKVEGKRDTLLRLLVRAGIALTEDDRARIQACEDADTLDRWIDNVLGAKTASEVLS